MSGCLIVITVRLSQRMPWHVLKENLQKAETERQVRLYTHCEPSEEVRNGCRPGKFRASRSQLSLAGLFVQPIEGIPRKNV